MQQLPLQPQRLVSSGTTWLRQSLRAWSHLSLPGAMGGTASTWTKLRRMCGSDP